MTILEGLLICIVAMQQGFYMWQINKLVNKLMSRDYHTYHQSVTPPPVMGGFRVQLPQDDTNDILKELNNTIKPPF